MIDLENYIFNNVATSLRTNFPGVLVSGEYLNEPKSFPCVTIEQIASSVVEDFRTENIENLTAVTFEINVYSNKASGRKAEAKSIINKADELITALGFTRTMLNPIPNIADATIYRFTARYQAKIDRKVTISGDSTNETYIIYQN